MLFNVPIAWAGEDIILPHLGGVRVLTLADKKERQWVCADDSLRGVYGFLRRTEGAFEVGTVALTLTGGVYAGDEDLEVAPIGSLAGGLVDVGVTLGEADPSGAVFLAGARAQVAVLDRGSWRVSAFFQGGSPVVASARARGGGLVLATRRGGVYLWSDLRMEARLPEIAHGFTPDASDTPRLDLLNAVGSGVIGASVLDDGRVALACFQSIVLWDHRADSCQFVSLDDPITHACAVGNRLALADADHVRIWDARMGLRDWADLTDERVTELGSAGDEITVATTKRAFTSSDDLHTGPCTAVRVSRNGKCAIRLSTDETVFWPPAAPPPATAPPAAGAGAPPAAAAVAPAAAAAP